MKTGLFALLLALPLSAFAQEENKYDCGEQVKAFAKANLDLKAKAKGLAESQLVTDAMFKGEVDFGAEGNQQKIGVFYVAGTLKEEVALVALGMDSACDPKVIQFPVIKE